MRARKPEPVCDHRWVRLVDQSEADWLEDICIKCHIQRGYRHVETITDETARQIREAIKRYDRSGGR